MTKIRRLSLVSPHFRMMFLVFATPFLAGGSPADPALKVLQVWTEGPFEVRIAFNRPVDPGMAGGVVGSTIAFEELNVVKESPDVPRGSLHVTAAKLLNQGTTLALVTDPHPRAGRYTLTLPKALPVHYSLNGFEATWESDDPNALTGVKGWLPSLVFADCRPEVAETRAFEEVLNLLKKPGKLTLTTQLILPAGTVSVRLKTGSAVEATLGGEEPLERLEPKAGAEGFALFRAESTGEPLFFSVIVPTGPEPDGVAMSLTYGVGESEAADRPVTSAQTLLPWVAVGKTELAPLAGVPNLEGGSPAAGKLVFQGAAGKCATCHKVGGEGGSVGPDLSSLVGRDRLSVYRDIADPSGRIHPDYVGYTVARKDGTVLVGTVRSVGESSVQVTNSEAKSTTIPRDSVEEFRPSAASIMPVGLAGALGEEKLRDLIAYLVSERGR